MGRLTIEAPAKINLILDILRRRPDGYHDLRMVMQSVSLCDTVSVETGVGAGVIRVNSGAWDLPNGPENLAWQAAGTFFEETGLPNGGVEITLKKRIPVCAGMAGGSTDAAAVLRALQVLLCPELTEKRLEEIGGKVGSDVPFCVRGGTALAEGRGERLTTLPPLPACTLVLCKPGFGLSTPELFGRVRADTLTWHPDTDGMCRALTSGDLTGVAERVANVFERILRPEEGDIFSIREILLRHGALAAAMTGSGPTVFGIFDGEDRARTAVEALRTRYSQIFVVKPL